MITSSLNFIPPIIAHRGASSLAPENTLIAFTKAAQLGVKWVEFDVMLAACNTPVIIHDDQLDRTTDAKGFVSNFTYDYLQSLDAGSWFDTKFSGEKIPTLVQVLEFLQTVGVSANIEFKAKEGEEKKLVQKVLAEIQPFLAAKKISILFSSFSLRTLKYLRHYSPDCLLAVLMHEWESNWETNCAVLKCSCIDINHEIITPEGVKKIHDLGKKVLCYTVNDPTRALTLYSWGVDAIFTDVPDKILTLLK